MKSKKYWIYTYEIRENFFIAVFEDLLSNEQFFFRINIYYNDLKLLKEFYDDNIKYAHWHLGFDNIAKESQITEYIISNYDAFITMSNKEISKYIYNYSKDLAKNKYLDYLEYRLRIKVIDIFKINNWKENTSLNWIQFSIDWDSIEEIINKLTQNDILEYCINKVKSIKAIYNYEDEDGKKIMLEKIKFRFIYSKQLNLRLYSLSNTNMAERILSKFIGIYSKKETTEDDIIKVKDLLLPYINFKNNEFNKAYEWFKKLEIKKLKSIKYTIQLSGFDINFTTSKIHGACNPGIYNSTNGKTIKTLDVYSFFPSMVIQNNWHPSHLPNDFNKYYKWFYNERPKANSLIKDLLNIICGLTSKKYSFLYDPEMLIKIYTNGQLLLAMLIDMLIDKIPLIELLLINTDGCEFLVPNDKLYLYDNIISEWETITGLKVKSNTYDKMFIWSNNNYIAKYSNNKIKSIGRFKFKNLSLDANKSALIIPKAIFNYFINKINPEDYIKKNNNIFDYCIGVKNRPNEEYYKLSNKDGYERIVEAERVLRYYISNKGYKLFKQDNKGIRRQLEDEKWNQTIFNKYENKKHDINIEYYLEKIYKEINLIDPNKGKEFKQLTLNL